MKKLVAVLIGCVVASCSATTEIWEVDSGTSPEPQDERDTSTYVPPTDTGVVPTVPDASGPADVGPSTPDATEPEPDVPVVEPEEPFTPPQRILFIGNSFTLGGPIPTLVDQLANDAGWPDPEVVMSAFGGESLQGHSGRTGTTVARVDEGNWDVVVLQEYSTRPTDNLGDPGNFKQYATWFHDRIKASSPNARVVLYETWARHPSHNFYPGSFANPAQMQAQLRTHYYDAATRAIPAQATAPVMPEVEVAPAGDAWERHLAQGDAVRLHGTDNYHAGSNGEYLNALVLYATIYRRSVRGRTSLGRNGTAAAALQRDADATTGWTTQGGPDSTPLPLGLAPGQKVQLDFGGGPLGDGWTTLTDTSRYAQNVVDSANARTSLDIEVPVLFQGTNPDGLGANNLGWPAGASGDTLFCGSFDSHADGLTKPARVVVSGLAPGRTYGVRAFASRAGADAGFGRLTRYTVTGTSAQSGDLDATDNSANTANFDVTATANGSFTVDIAVSPAGTSRFCYLGVLEIVGR